MNKTFLYLIVLFISFSLYANEGGSNGGPKPGVKTGEGGILPTIEGRSGGGPRLFDGGNL